MTDSDLSHFSSTGQHLGLPQPHDQEQRIRFQQMWLDQAASTVDFDIDDTTSCIGPFRVSDIFDCVFGNSPFLSKAIIKNPECVKRMVAHGPEHTWTALLEDLKRDATDASTNIPELMKCLRRHKERAALCIAICDITGLWNLDAVVKRLSEFADKCIRFTLSNLLIAESEKENIALPDPDDPFVGCGIFVLALGKLGAGELNYSSDIDLMVLFDNDSLPYSGKKTSQEFAVKLTKTLIKVLDERTADGYVFRTDLRLRPDPASTSVAVSTEAAELYYESWGQNWERSALIKSRTVAGDEKIAAQFLTHLEPFIWRKSLDFYAIQDIHSIKRQMYAHKGGANIEVLGHDIKVGRGGIWEVEFFVQIQQLIWGGRNPSLRLSRTLDGLSQLMVEDLITAQAHDELTNSYRFLRNLEHRLQMVNDEQTQTIPLDIDRATAIATFFGCETLDTFIDSVTHHLRQIERHYANLFEGAPTLAIDGNLVFTGTDHDPETLKTLENLGFVNPEAVSQIIRAWHHGRYRATRSTRSRQILTELVPRLLTAFGNTAQPDRAFLKFDQSLQKLPAGIQLFSVFYANPDVLDLVADIMGDAPRLADYLIASTQRLDYVLDPVFFDNLPNEKALEADLWGRIQRSDNFEAKLDDCVRWTNDLRFRIGVLVLREFLTPAEGSNALGSIADVVIRVLIPEIVTEFENRFGTIDSSSLAVLAYGKLGARELMPASDLDLVIIYEAEDDAHSTGTNRNLPASAYFIRLAQRIVSTLTSMTPEGRLYDVDMRLRPSGEQGPYACSFQAFKKYQNTDAWVWEHLALTRARVIFSTNTLGTNVNHVLHSVLTRKRDAVEVGSEIIEMRDRIRGEFGDQGQWDIKKMQGGLMDTEFLIQFYVLTGPLQRDGKTLTGSLEIIESLIKQGILEERDGNSLQQAIRLWLSILWLLRLTMDSNSVTADIPRGPMNRLQSVTSTPSQSILETLILDTSHKVSKLFDTNIKTGKTA